MPKIKLKFIVGAFVFILHTFSFGQEIATSSINSDLNLKPYIPSIGSPSPSAYKFSTFGQILMENNSGAFNYSLSLYNIKFHDFDIPINLNYHSSGVKIDDLSSIVGTDWNLTAGGIISRIMRGKPDERSNRWYPDSTINPTKEYKKILQITGSGQTNMEDTEPDWFSFNINGITGTFYLDQNLNIQLESNESIKLTYKKVSDSSNGPIWEFTLIDNKGYKYILGGTDEYLETNDNFSNCDPIPRPLSYYSSWYLKEIISPTKNKIIFNYDTNFLTYYAGISHNITLTEPCYCTDDSKKMDYIESECTTLNNLKSKILSSIRFEDNSVEFEYDTDRKDNGGVTLKNIIIKNQNKITKKISLSYDMIYSLKGKFTARLKNVPSLNYRLFLKKVAFYGNDNYTENYSFEYYDKDKLPSRLSLAKDIYGYYNGADQNTSPYSSEIKNDREAFYIFRPYGIINKFTANQSPNPSTIHYGMLKKIIYPTGGYSKIIYEPNSTLENNKITKYTIKNINLTKPCNYPGTKDAIFTFVSNGSPINFDVQAFLDTYQNGCTATSDPTHENFNFSIMDVTTGKILVSATRKYGDNFTSDNFLICDSINKNQANSYPERVYPVCTKKGHSYKINMSLLSKPFSPSYGRAIIKYNSNDSLMKVVSYKSGARIKEISDYSENQQYNRKKFFYNKLSKYPSDSSSLNYFPTPSYVKKSSMLRFCRYTCCINFNMGEDFHTCANTTSAKNGDLKNKYEISSSSLNSLFDKRNSTNTYTYITQFFEDNQNINGIIEREYISKDDIKSINILPPEISNAPFSNTGVNITGLLKSERIYDAKKKAISSKSLLYNYLINQSHYSHIIHKNYSFSDLYISEEMKNSLQNISIQEYRNHIATVKIHKSIDSTFFLNNTLVTTSKYTYNKEPYLNLKTQSSSTSTGELITQYQYPPDLAASHPLMQELTEQNRIGTPVTTEIRRVENGREKQLSFSRIEYAKDASTSQLILPKFVYSKKGDASLEKKISYDRYDSHGNLLQYTPEDALPVSIIWGYNLAYPIAKIEGATYSQVESWVENLQKLSNDDNQSGLLDAFTQLRAQLTNARITSYTYQPLVGVTSITAPNSLTEFYSYDSMGRLMQIKDSDGNLLKSFEYNYKSQN